MEHRTGLEDRYVLKNNKRLRCGYTTGTCAAAAAKAAAFMLFLKKDIREIELTVPEGTCLHLAVEEICREPEAVSCAVRKDGGDVDAITASTISSRAFSDAVSRAYEVYKSIQNSGNHE